MVKEAGFKDGEELVANVKDGKLIIKKIKK